MDSDAIPFVPSSSIDVLDESRDPIMEDALEVVMVYDKWQSSRHFPIFVQQSRRATVWKSLRMSPTPISDAHPTRCVAIPICAPISG